MNQLDEGSENFYRRLMSVVDDYGRYDARLAVLRSDLYPLRADTMAASEVGRRLQACIDVHLVRLYRASGKAFLEMLDFRQQQRTKSRFPDPTAEVIETVDDINCVAVAKQVIAPFGDVVGDGVGVEGGGVPLSPAPESPAAPPFPESKEAPPWAGKQPGHHRIPASETLDVERRAVAVECGVDPETEWKKFMLHDFPRAVPDVGARWGRWCIDAHEWRERDARRGRGSDRPTEALRAPPKPKNFGPSTLRRPTPSRGENA